ncbi:ATP-dependent DNA helicase PIF1 [Zea mays]|uniref:ATP-dependent DNA helicase n=1 Tax=Zea mays TaxID=4577 RepID=A0A3L6DY77_MAIZE|nr:ATP-dependent DNA helicase PIF1 [Zea mays]
MTANILFYKTSLLELTLATRTVVDLFHLPIQFPPHPKHLMPFHEVLQQPHKRFIDVIGIVIHLAPLEHIGGRPYREAILMDSRCVRFYSNNKSFIYRWDIIVVGIWPELLQRNALRNLALHDPKSEECFNQQLSREETGLSGNSAWMSLLPWVGVQDTFGHIGTPKLVLALVIFVVLKYSVIRCISVKTSQTPLIEVINMDQARYNQLLMLRNVRDGCSTIDSTSFATQDVAGPKNNTQPDDCSIERKMQKQRERRANLSVEQRNELNKKRREARQRNNGQNMMPNAPRGGDEKVNVDPDDDSDWLHINYTLQSNNIDATTEVLTPGSVHENVGHTPKHTMQRTAYFSEQYKNLTPVEREFRRERLRLYNRTPRRKEAKVDHNRRRRVMQDDTLNQSSIAMEDPTYTPAFVHPTADAKGSDGSILSVCDWVIPEFINAPFLPSPTQTEDVASPDMSTNTLNRKHHVPRGERQAILARRNQLFQSAISRKVGTSIEDTSGDVVEGDDWTQRHMPMEITNNGDDDEGVIFEDDDDENEGYLFAAQYDDTDEDIEIDGTQDESTATYVSDPYDKVYSNIPEETHMLKLVPNCGYCTAKKFEYEPPGFCCRGGKVELAQVETPPLLKRLWDSADSDARHFRDNIRFFNGHLSFTSLYCCLDSMTTNVRDSGIYTFRAQGMCTTISSHLVGKVGQSINTLSFTFMMMIPVSSIGTIRPGVFNPILHGKRLFQQFAVDMYIKIESSRLDFIRKNQDRLRADLYQGLVDSMLDGDIRAEKDEIRRELLPGQTPQDRPDLVVRVFHAKLQELKHRLTKQDILGKRKYKLTCPEQYDLLISAEIPSNKYPELRKMVIKHMMHGTCGSLNPKCPCTKGRKSCKNHYPRPFSDTTLQGKDSYLVYRRRDDGRTEKVRGCELDNRWVVPYNPYLLRLFNCHINVEACGSIKAVKYLFKYIYKGHDRASVVIRYASKADDDVDEIKQYRDARWVTPPEASWRIYGFELSQISPPMIQLQLHPPNMHMVAFHERQMVERVVNRPGVDRSMLTAYFEANSLHEEARGILYRDFPEWYTWQSGKGKVWQQRKRDTGGQVGRIVSAHPAEGERYYLRALLNHVTGATSYVDLRTIDGVTLPTFCEAAERRGLLESDNTLDECLTERALFQMPSALRRLFATILVYCEPSDVAVLWQKHLDFMSEDYQHRNPCKTHVEQMVLIDIRNMLQSMGKDIKTFPLPPIMDAYDDAIGTAREVYKEEIIEPVAGDVALKDCLNKEQSAAYDKIMSAVDTDQGGLFFVDGPGGTGKTYLYRVLLATLRSQGKIAVATVTSGVAASIMPGGRTAHSRFKIPLTIDDGVVCSFTKQSGTAELLRKASLIIWDEASMTKRQAVETLDNSMRDIMGRPGLPFGGKTIAFGGDFRQVLPVVRKGSRAQVVASSLRMSYLWESMSHLKLVTNMRAKNDPWFAKYLLRVGGGTEDTNSDGDIRLPDEVCVPYSGSDSDLDNLIDFVFPDLNIHMSDSTYITSRAILSTRNEWVDMINVKMIDRFQGEHMVYHSFDSAMDDPHNYYPPEFLNTLTPNGLPPHVLKLKIGCHVILLWNIDPANGLCNGTRLVVRGFQRNSIDAEIVLGQHAGKRIFLPRIPLCPSDEEMFPFQFKRKQFPVWLSFAMTVNKAQGQTIPNVGVYLPEPVFSHGQLYVALSRATARSNIKILAIPPVDGKKTSRKGVRKNPTVDCGTYTKNIVYKEVLTN